MKSISEIVGGMVNTGENESTALIVSLPSRPCPLESVEIEKLEQAIGRFFVVKREPIYGYVPVKDKAGEVIRSEYDIIGEEELFTKTNEPPTQLRDALLRPAERRHTAFHLTRLAAHRRDTRGEDALAAVIEDIAMDLKGVSEWAVIMACRDFRQKPAIWYPTTGEIIESIRKNQRKIETLFVTINPNQLSHTQQKAIAHDKRAQTRWQDLPKDEWTKQHFDWAIAEMEGLVKAANGSPMGLSAEHWESEIARFRREKELVKA